MLANKLIRKNKIYSICEGSGDIQVGESFFGVRIVDPDALDRIPSDAQIAYCGKIKDNELLFRTIDGRFYFHCLMAGVLKEEPFMVCHMAFASILNIRRTKKLYYLNVKPSLVHITPGQAQWLIMKESVF